MRLGIVERLHHLISHADPSLDLTQLSDIAQEELQELDLLSGVDNTVRADETRGFQDKPPDYPIATIPLAECHY